MTPQREAQDRRIWNRWLPALGVLAAFMSLGFAAMLFGGVNWPQTTPSAVPRQPGQTTIPSPTALDMPTPSGPPAPDFTLPDIDGKIWSLSQFRGRPIVLFFWATW